VAGARRRDACGDLQRHLLHRPEKCTECVGFYDQEACAKVCPVDCCVPDPERPESEALLLERARALHPDKTIPDDSPSRFKKEGAAAPATNGHDLAAVAPAAAAPAPKPAAAPALKPAGAPAKAAASPAPKPVAGVRGRSRSRSRSRPRRRARHAPSPASCRSTSISSWPSSARRAGDSSRDSPC